MNPAILFVEDKVIIAADIANKLRKIGYEVLSLTDSGEEALEIARMLRPSLVLMDIRLAGAMDGITAADTIRKGCRKRQLPDNHFLCSLKNYPISSESNCRSSEL